MVWRKVTMDGETRRAMVDLGWVWSHADQSGALNGNAKLSPADVEEIRQLYAAGEKQAALGKRFGVSQGHISGIVTRVKWR